jgi:hypothetical protein
MRLIIGHCLAQQQMERDKDKINKDEDRWPGGQIARGEVCRNLRGQGKLGH